MGQLSGKLKNMSLVAPAEERVPYDENSNNGFIFNDEHYIPEELLLDLLSHYVDYKTLRSCQLVCKQWNLLMKNYVWRKKAELILNHPLPLDEDTPWTTYYLICHKKPFNRNLIRNHSGQKNLSSDRNWTIVSDGGDGWTVESPPTGVAALPDDPIFNGTNCCFVTSYGKCWKQQVVDLVKEGFSEYLLDTWQPPIKVSEWFSSRWDCAAVYVCTTELMTEVEGLSKNVVLNHYNYSRTMREDEQNQWFKFEHEFKNYGKGLRKIKFSHGGQDSQFWAGHYGSKMAGACITLEVPDGMPQEVPHPPEETTSSEPYYPPDDYPQNLYRMYGDENDSDSNAEEEEELELEEEYVPSDRNE